MSNRILITGGSGMVGSRLTEMLIEDGYEVIWLSRLGKAMPNVVGYQWNIENQTAEDGAFHDLHAIIHLAGEGIANKRWTAKQRKKILDSRVKSANLLYSKLIELKETIELYISASGTGYYGYDNGEKELLETTEPGKDFLSEVVQQWEASADQFKAFNARVVKLRIGMVLSNNGGALEKMTLPVKMRIGAPLGNGKQFISWVHIDDLCRLVMYVLRNKKTEGVYNAASSNSVTNALFTKAIATTFKKPLFLPNVPSFVLKVMFGEMSNLILGSGKVSPQKIIDSGFTFKYNDLEGALCELLKTK